MRKLISKISRILPDKLYLQLMFYRHFGYFMDFQHPKTFNEKLQWLKVYEKNPLYTKLCDKIAVKEYVARKIGEEFVAKIYKTWDRIEDLDIEDLPKKFVIKCNHDSKSVVICHDKNSLDIDSIRKFLAAHFNNNGFWYGREWPYKNIKPRIFAEEYLGETSEVLLDYKVLCFNGNPLLIECHNGRFTDHYTQDFYDKDWNKLDIEQIGAPKSDILLEKPNFLDQMLNLSAILSKNIKHVRIDWYHSHNQLYFGEFTFFDGSGFVPFIPNSFDEYLGNMIEISK